MIISVTFYGVLYFFRWLKIKFEDLYSNSGDLSFGLGDITGDPATGTSSIQDDESTLYYKMTNGTIHSQFASHSLHIVSPNVLWKEENKEVLPTCYGGFC